MKKYEKPVVMLVEGFAEGVYAASGSVGCYDVNAVIHQKPEQGRGDYRISLYGAHNAADSHHSTAQYLTLGFNMPVSYVGSNGMLVGGDGTMVLYIEYAYHNNGVDNIGLGDVIVQADQGLAVTHASLDCNRNCIQH